MSLLSIIVNNEGVADLTQLGDFCKERTTSSSPGPSSRPSETNENIVPDPVCSDYTSEGRKECVKVVGCEWNTVDKKNKVCCGGQSECPVR